MQWVPEGTAGVSEYLPHQGRLAPCFQGLSNCLQEALLEAPEVLFRALGREQRFSSSPFCLAGDLALPGPASAARPSPGGQKHPFVDCLARSAFRYVPHFQLPGGITVLGCRKSSPAVRVSLSQGPPG